MNKLSVVLATKNEQDNIKGVIDSVIEIADEIIILDEMSTDKTREIAKRMGARIFKVKHEPIFHITKQKALNKASGEWILQLDADERLSHKLRGEIRSVINMNNDELLQYKITDLKKRKLFDRHQKLLEQRDGKIGNSSNEVVAFFLPRINYFLGKPIRYAGVYPDGVIRLVKNGKARFPQQSVHEQMTIDGKVRWLNNDLEHHDSPTLRRYVARMNRYTDLQAKELSAADVKISLLNIFLYSTFKPFYVFMKLFIRHKGFLNGMRGFIWSLMSALHFPLAYYKYWEGSNVR